MVVRVRSMDTLNADNSRASANSSDAPNSIIEDTRNSWFSLELLFNITDVVLIICGVVVIISCIATIALWSYGLWLADWQKIPDGQQLSYLTK